MQTQAQLESAKSIGIKSAKPILLIAAWFGLVTGLVEGSVFLILQQLHWLNFNIALTGVWWPIIWISPLFDFLLFSSIGLLIATSSRLLRRFDLFRVALFGFTFLMVFDWLSLSGRISPWGVFWLAIGVGTAVARRLGKSHAEIRRFWPRTLPWIAGVTALAFVAVEGGGWLNERLAIAQSPAAAANSPNILVIIVDTLRADHLSSYGYSRVTSPNLDRIAQEGVLFENAISAAPWTLPSHASLLTGRYVFEHGADPKPYDGRYPTLGQALQTRGYRTAAFSANIIFFTRGWGFGQGFTHFEDYFGKFGDTAVRPLYGLTIVRKVLLHLGYMDLPGRKHAADVNRAALNWIGNDRRPFFVVLNYLDVHDAYLPPEPYRSKFSTFKGPGGIVNGLVWRTGRFNPPLTPDQVQSEMDAYDGGIAYVDDSIEQLLRELKQRGLENTILVITADHGEGFQDHGSMSHGHSLYREEIHVPLIFYWPGHLPVGKRISLPVSLTWLAPTLMGFAGEGNQSIFPGPSVASLWQTTEVRSDWPVPLSEVAVFGRDYQRKDTLRSLVSPKWHFITSHKQPPELYDWRADPHELRNLADTPEGQQIITEFGGQLQHLIARAQNPR
jgi:arylsulfatase A-like enzyme